MTDPHVRPRALHPDSGVRSGPVTCSRIVRVAIVLVASAVAAPACERGPVLITVDPATRHQVISGWEATAEAGQTEVPGFELIKDALFDLAVFEVGINRIRLPIYSNLENPRDWFAARMSGEIDFEEWRCNRFASIDDNGDPDVIDWNGFQFSHLDDTIERVVLPLARRLESRGEKLYINAMYNASLRPCPDAPYHHHQDVREYAEFALAVHLYMRDRWGISPDAWEVLLEPENSRWTARQMGGALVAAGERLAAHGFTPDFIAPSNSNMANALMFWDTITAVPGVRRFLDEFSYHRYGGVTADNLERIGLIGREQNVRTSMLEHIGSGHEDLHADLETGRVSAWQQFALAYRGRGERGGAYIVIDGPDTTRLTVSPGGRTKFLRQYFLFVRAGATRVGSSTSRTAFGPLAFVNADGTHVVVIKAERAGTFVVRGLPPATYGITYTTDAAYNVELDDVTIGPGETVQTGIPAPGVLTVYGRR